MTNEIETVRYEHNYVVGYSLANKTWFIKVYPFSNERDAKKYASCNVDINIEDIEAQLAEKDAEIARLRECHESELGVCYRYCDEVIAKDAEIERLKKENAVYQEELQEQALLNGMGSEREARLLGRIAEKDRIIAKCERALKEYIESDETNEGDKPLPEHGGHTWNEINEDFIAIKHAAIRCLEEIAASKEEK